MNEFSNSGNECIIERPKRPCHGENIFGHLTADTDLIAQN